MTGIRLREVVSCTTMDKKDRLIVFVYIALVILLPPLMGWTVAPWRDASLADFARRFSNLIPLRGIWESIARGRGTWLIAQLRLYGLHMAVMIPLGLLVGCFWENMTGKDMGRICLVGVFGFTVAYALRLLLKLGSFDVDDILMNVIGLWIGLFMASVFQKLGRLKNQNE